MGDYVDDVKLIQLEIVALWKLDTKNKQNKAVVK